MFSVPSLFDRDPAKVNGNGNSKTNTKKDPNKKSKKRKAQTQGTRRSKKKNHNTEPVTIPSVDYGPESDSDNVWASPNDPTERKVIDIRTLNLSQPWQGELPASATALTPARLPRVRRWPYVERMVPINDSKDLPEGWVDTEDDLALE